MFDKGQEANGMCACTLLESLCLASPFAVESCGQISVGVGIGWYLHPRNLTWIPGYPSQDVSLFKHIAILGIYVEFPEGKKFNSLTAETLSCFNNTWFRGPFLSGLHRSLPCRARKRRVTGVLGGVWGSGWCCLEPLETARWEKEVATRCFRAKKESRRDSYDFVLWEIGKDLHIYMDIFCILYVVDKLRL